MGARPPYPLTGNDKWGSAGMDFVRRAETVRVCDFWQTGFQLRVLAWQISHSHHSDVPSAGESMCFLAKRLPTSRTGLEDFTFSAIGCALRRREHAISGKQASSSACLPGRFRIPTIRVCPPLGVGCALRRSACRAGRFRFLIDSCLPYLFAPPDNLMKHQNNLQF